MRLSPPKEGLLQQEPSPWLKKLSGILNVLPPGPVLDAPCGYGRNALLFRQLGHTVVCTDNDLKALQAIAEVEMSLTSTQKREGKQRTMRKAGHLLPLYFDLTSKGWPFPCAMFSMIVNVHFVYPALFPTLIYSLSAGGYLYCETFDGHGNNYRGLPRAGCWKGMLEPWLVFEFYREKRVGPLDQEAVSIKFLARKREGAGICLNQHSLPKSGPP